MPLISHLQLDGSEVLDYSQPDEGWGPFARWRVAKMYLAQDPDLLARTGLVVVAEADLLSRNVWVMRRGPFAWYAVQRRRVLDRAIWPFMVKLYLWGIWGDFPEMLDVSPRDALRTTSLRPSTLRRRRREILEN